MNFSLILFSCLFFYANSIGEVHENEEGRSRSSKPPCTFRGQPFHCLIGGICEKFEQEKVNKCEKNENLEKQKKKEFASEFDGKNEKKEFDFTKIEGVDKKLFVDFLASTANAELLLKVFKYLTHLKEEPICLTKITVDSLAKLNGHTEEEAERALKRAKSAKNGLPKSETGCELLATKVQDSARCSRKVLEKQRGDKGAKGDAFLFGEEGVVEILIGEDGWKCAESLLHPEKVALLLQSVIKTLQANAGKNQSFVDTLHLVMENLDCGERDSVKTSPKSPAKSRSAAASSPKVASPKAAALLSSVSIKSKALAAPGSGGNSGGTSQKTIATASAPSQSWTVELKAKWKTTWTSLKKKGFKRDLEDFAVWLLRPSHIDGLIQILLFLSGYAGIVDVSLLGLQLFGLDDLFTKGLEKIGVKVVEYTGANSGLVKWGFGPNGVFPLFLRYGQKEDSTEEGEYQLLLDQAGKVHKLKKMRREEEEEFLKKIIAELIERKGRPMHELMDHLLESLDKMEERAKQSWAEHVAKWKEGWKTLKSHLNKNAIRADLKTFAVWFVTPDRVNILIEMLLAITGTATPVYLSLSVLEMYGITDRFLAELKLVDGKLENKYPKWAKEVQFFAGPNGVVAQFLKQADLDDETERENRNQRAADLIQIVGQVAINHSSAGMLVAKLGEYFIETVQSKEFNLQVIQAWNLLSEKYHEKVKNLKLAVNGQQTPQIYSRGLATAEQFLTRFSRQNYPLGFFSSSP